MTLCFPVAEETVSNETVIKVFFFYLVLENGRHVIIENVAKHQNGVQNRDKAYFSYDCVISHANKCKHINREIIVNPTSQR